MFWLAAANCRYTVIQFEMFELKKESEDEKKPKN
jgi:hypothetical protein